MRRSACAGALLATGLLLTACSGTADPSSPAAADGKGGSVAVPAADLDPEATGGTETAVLAGGCFWGVEGVFEHVEGVTDVVSGYAGGSAGTAFYADVSSGTTDHAEAVKVTFDPQKISYAELLRIYFAVAHDPTELNRQGPDEGPQYRSTIFAGNADQAKVAKAYIAQLDDARAFGTDVVTTIETGKTFYPAEGVHQDFMAKNPDYPYIVEYDAPKIVALKKDFPALYRA